MLYQVQEQKTGSCTEEDLNYIPGLTQYQISIKSWTTHTPPHLLSVDYLIKAEIARILGDKANAIERYEQAIEAAVENHSPLEQALAQELGAKFFLSWKKTRLAVLYLQEAHQIYQSLGASQKLKQLCQAYPTILTPEPEPPPIFELSESRAHAAFDQVTVGIFECDLPSGLLTRVNDFFCDLLGYSREELLEKSFLEITYLQDIEHSLHYIYQLNQGNIDHFNVEKRFLHKDGSTIWSITNVTLVKLISMPSFLLFSHRSRYHRQEKTRT
ncbi:MAG: PAS domain S-box protein [Acaryochloridaceae cyanobacterium RL_2_7]|nr:PAS domain S-box protein [Acaryochloridaceae cyanobacterium RL_2_7]